MSRPVRIRVGYKTEVDASKIIVRSNDKNCIRLRFGNYDVKVHHNGTEWYSDEVFVYVRGISKWERNAFCIDYRDLERICRKHDKTKTIRHFNFRMNPIAMGAFL